MNSAVSDGWRATRSSRSWYTPRSASESWMVKVWTVALRAMSALDDPVADHAQAFRANDDLVARLQIHPGIPEIERPEDDSRGRAGEDDRPGTYPVRLGEQRDGAAAVRIRP